MYVFIKAGSGGLGNLPGACGIDICASTNNSFLDIGT